MISRTHIGTAMLENEIRTVIVDSGVHLHEDLELDCWRRWTKRFWPPGFESEDVGSA
jgi:hypothetical protein